MWKIYESHHIELKLCVLRLCTAWLGMTQSVLHRLEAQVTEKANDFKLGMSTTNYSGKSLIV